MGPVRVLVADDHTLVRAGIRALLLALEGIEVVAEAGDGREALALARAHRPDVLLTDIAMPHLSGLELAGVVARELAPTRVVILSMHASEEYASRALQARAVARGETYLSPAVSKHVIAEYLRRTGGAPAGGPLTPRQREILRLVAEGLTTKGIARRLGISDKTVESHRAQMMDRLGIHDLAGLIRYAIRTGLVGPEEWE
jgi:DNA-binding NarL/FixJ family response regulator